KSQQKLCVAVCDSLFIGGAHRELLEELARLRHRTIGIVGREYDSVGTNLREQVKEWRREVETTNRVVDVLSQISADRATQFRHCHRQVAIYSGKHEWKGFAQVANDKLQARVSVECSAQNEAEGKDCGFDVPSPT